MDTDFQIDDLKFEWDKKKNAINKQKHGVAFEDAVRVFLDENALDIPDDSHSADEDRRIIIGKVKEVLFVVYTERTDITRIISARKATPKERRLYYGGIRDLYFA